MHLPSQVANITAQGHIGTQINATPKTDDNAQQSCINGILRFKDCKGVNIASNESRSGGKSMLANGQTQVAPKVITGEMIFEGCKDVNILVSQEVPSSGKSQLPFQSGPITFVNVGDAGRIGVQPQVQRNSKIRTHRSLKFNLRRRLWCSIYSRMRLVQHRHPVGLVRLRNCPRRHNLKGHLLHLRHSAKTLHSRTDSLFHLCSCRQ
jgi:hypothetical protein